MLRGSLTLLDTVSTMPCLGCKAVNICTMPRLPVALHSSTASLCIKSEAALA